MQPSILIDRLRPLRGGIALALLVSGFVLRDHWFPAVESWVESSIAARRRASSGSAQEHPAGSVEDDAHRHGDHAHEHDEVESLELSETALRNLGLTSEFIRPVELTTYRRSITVPAMVAERPGRTRLQVATPMTGVVMHVHAVEGEAVQPGTLLFQIRLTHEDLVQAQTRFLQTLGELDVEQREIERLSEAAQTGAVPRVRLLEREYASDKLKALLSAQREALRLHGLSETQVSQISSDRRLLRELQVFAPNRDEHSEDELKLANTQFRPIVWRVEGEADSTPLVLSELQVHKGQSVTAGETLCVLSDYQDLFIEGLAFEQDARSIAAAAAQEWPVSAVIEQSGNVQETLTDLQIVRLSNEVDADSRTLRFFVRLVNEVESRTSTSDGNEFVGWRYRPGQRLQLRIPVEEWADQIVLPVDAVTKDGPEFYVFQQNGDHFDRVAVHVKYRDQASVVIANDGTLFPGDVVALRGAHQMQMALKNRSGGGVDPHAGHSH